MIAAQPVTERKEWHLPKGRLSFKQVRSYLSCSECYRLEYIEEVPAPVSVALPVGAGVHEGIAFARRKVRNGQPYKMYDCLKASLHAFADCAGARVPEDADAMGVLKQAVENGDVAIDLGKDFSSLENAATFTANIVQDTVDRIIEKERAVGYELIEADIEYDLSVFGLPFTGRIDCLTKDWCIRELKTASKNTGPDFWAGLQLRIQAMPLWCAEDPFTLGLTQIVKNLRKGQQMHDINNFNLPVTDGQMRWARQLVVEAAEGISKGVFVAKPSYTCDYSHDLPSFISIPTEVAA